MSELFSSRKKTPNKIYHCVCFVRNHKLLGSVHIVWLINEISESQRRDGHCAEKLSLLHGFKIFFCTAIGILDSPNFKKKHTQKPTQMSSNECWRYFHNDFVHNNKFTVCLCKMKWIVIFDYFFDLSCFFSSSFFLKLDKLF